jgi:hypothetical protein
VSKLKPAKEANDPFNLIRGSWYRERCIYEVEEVYRSLHKSPVVSHTSVIDKDLKKADAIEITSEGKELYVRRKEKMD